MVGEVKGFGFGYVHVSLSNMVASCIKFFGILLSNVVGILD